MFHCLSFARQLVEKGPSILTPELLNPRIRPWRNRPYPPILNKWRLEKIKFHLKNTFGKDPQAFGLPATPQPEQRPVLPKLNAVHWARKAARKEFVQQQLAKMDDIIAEWRQKRKAERDELKTKKAKTNFK